MLDNETMTIEKIVLVGDGTIIHMAMETQLLTSIFGSFNRGFERSWQDFGS